MAFSSMRVTSSCSAREPTKRSRSTQMVLSSIAGGTAVLAWSMVSKRGSPYSSARSFSASTTPSVKITSQSPLSNVTSRLVLACLQNAQRNAAVCSRSMTPSARRRMGALCRHSHKSGCAP